MKKIKFEEEISENEELGIIAMFLASLALVLTTLL